MMSKSNCGNIALRTIPVYLLKVFLGDASSLALKPILTLMLQLNKVFKAILIVYVISCIAT